MLRFFYFPDPSTSEIYTLSLHDALPIFKKDSHIKQNKWLQKVINIGLVLYVVSSGIFLSIALFNTAQKIIPLGHMKSYAKVNDRVVEKGRGRFVTDTHYIIEIGRASCRE